jgi:hypothetical protein
MYAKILLLISLLVCFTAPTSAQHFMYESGRFVVTQSGYHKIELSEQVVNRLNASFSNVRIYDAKEQEILHFLQACNPISPTLVKKELSLHSQTQKQGCCTELVLLNENQALIDNLVLHLKITNETKTIDISGSQDHEQWAVLRDTFKVYTQNQNSLKIVGLTRSDYKYLKIRIDDFNSSPLAIEKVFYETSLFPKDSYNRLLMPTVQQPTQLQHVDSISYVDFSFEERQAINWLDFQFATEQPNYAYNIELQAKKDSLGFFEHIQTFQFTPEKPNYLILPKLYGQFFRLKIHNYKQKKLQITAIQPYQLKHYLVANLTAHQPYLLRFGGENHQSSTQAAIVGVEIPDSLEIVYPDSIKMIGKSPNPLHIESAKMNSFWSFKTSLLIIGTLFFSALLIWVFFKRKRALVS